MGLFGKSEYKKFEKTIIAFYINALMAEGMAEGDSKKAVHNWVVDARRELGTKDPASDKGVAFLNSIKENPTEQATVYYETVSKEGVTDTDIIEWYDMQPLERFMMLKFDQQNQMAMIIQLIQDGEAEDVESAIKRTYKVRPWFGDPNDESKAKGDDRPLPYELKGRINRFIEKNMGNADNFKKKLDNSSSLNAVVREAIKNGDL